ncbi:MAG: aldo/keto reductase [Acidimicrobiales bacterium]
MGAPLLMLNSGAGMPQIGLGTWPMNDAEVADAVVSAIQVGYRHFDTALAYGNEAGVAEGVRRSGIDRAEVFITTKLNGDFQGEDRAIAGLQASLDRMRLDYVDLLLIHWPLPARGQFVSTWHTFEQLYHQGRARSIGVSNFKAEHLATLAQHASVAPAVNQIQLNPYITRDQQRHYGTEHAVTTVAWSPLGGDGARILQNATVADIAQRIGRSVGQVVLRWHVQRGWAAVPKSANPARLAENLAVFDFALSDADMAALNALSRGPDAGVDSDQAGH